MEYGYQYTTSNGWSQIWEKSPSFTQYPVQGLFNAGLNLEIYIKPTLTIELYGVVGPGMDVRPYLDFAATAHNKDVFWHWDLIGGVDGNVFFNAHILDWQLINYSKELFDWNTLIASDNGVISGGQKPIVTTANISNIGQTSATGGGNVTDQGSSAVTARGICWSTFSNPTTSNAHTTNGSGTGSFTSSITGLTANTPYYVRAYATNSTGTAYGSQVSFTTTGGSAGEPCPGIPTITDPRDGQVYPTVQIGSQCWLQKNMNYQTGNSWCYENNTSNCSTYGRLYDWQTALGVCTVGWHLPSDEEWTALSNFLGGEAIAGGPIKETGLDHWASPNIGATNESGFTALPGGIRLPNENFTGLTTIGYFWSSSSYDGTMKYAWHLFNDQLYLDHFPFDKASAFSVRCLKD